MPVPDFDHNVQQQLKELKLPLSETVWEKLEARLRQRRKRRVIFLLIFMIFLLSGIGFLIQTQPFGTKTVSINENLNSYDTTAKHSEHSRSGITLPHSAGQNSGGQDHLTINQELNPGELDNKGSLENASLKIKNKAVKDIKNVLTEGGTFKQSFSPSIKTKKAGKDLSIFHSVRSTFKEFVATEQPIDPEFEKVLLPYFSGKPVLFRVNTPAIATDINGVTISSGIKSTVRRNNPPRWYFGIQSAIGASTLVSGGLLNIREKTVLASNSVSSGGFTGNFVPPPASTVREGRSWNTGIWARRNLSRKWAIEGGLNYLEQSAVISTGSLIDSLQFGSPSRVFMLQSTGLYRNGNSNIYANRYRFMELPISIKYTLNPQAKVPVSFSGGIAFNRLVQSKALNYDQSTGVYFADEDLFRKTQWSIHSGLNLTLAARRKHPVDIGARMRYAGTPLYKSRSDNNKNLVGLSLEAKWYIR